MLKLKCPVFLLLLSIRLFGQEAPPDSMVHIKKRPFNYASLVIPASMITYGVVGLESHSLINLNAETRGELKEHIDDRFTIDDFSQYSPAIAVFGLSSAGIKSKNSFGDRLLILSTAYVMMGSTVTILKRTAQVTRPDGTSRHSFPSGHTATAFMGAEFLYQEYKDVSPWYGIAGYAVAAGTGFFRMYNDRHWLTDVVAGAGIGIVSTKLAYLIHPKKVFKSKQDLTGVIWPYTNGHSYGMGVTLKF